MTQDDTSAKVKSAIEALQSEMTVTQTRLSQLEIAGKDVQKKVDSMDAKIEAIHCILTRLAERRSREASVFHYGPIVDEVSSINLVLTAFASTTTFDEPACVRGCLVHEELISHEDSVFDEALDVCAVAREVVPNPIAAVAAPTVVDVKPNNTNSSAPSTCSTKCSSGGSHITTSVAVCSTCEEPFTDHIHTVATPMSITSTPSNGNAEAPASCLMKCSSSGGNIMASVRVPVNLKDMAIRSGGDLTNLCCFSLVDMLVAFVSDFDKNMVTSLLLLLLDWGERLPWPPLILLGMFLDNAKVRPLPWPFFISSDACYMNWDVGWGWKSPWPLLKYVVCIVGISVSASYVAPAMPANIFPNVPMNMYELHPWLVFFSEDPTCFVSKVERNSNFTVQDPSGSKFCGSVQIHFLVKCWCNRNSSLCGKTESGDLTFNLSVGNIVKYELCGAISAFVRQLLTKSGPGRSIYHNQLSRVKLEIWCIDDMLLFIDHISRSWQQRHGSFLEIVVYLKIFKLSQYNQLST